MNAADEEKKEILQYKVEYGNIGGVVSHASRTCCAIPLHTYKNGALVTMDWALLKVSDSCLGSNKVIPQGEDVGADLTFPFGLAPHMLSFISFSSAFFLFLYSSIS